MLTNGLELPAAVLAIDPDLLALLEHARDPGVSAELVHLAKVIEEALVRRTEAQRAGTE